MGTWGIFGHDWAVELLARDLAGDRLRHAYLFTGPSGIGKRSLAVKFAQAINCLSPSRPCGECRPCTLIAKGLHPDAPLVHSGLTVSGAAAVGRAARAGRTQDGGPRSIKIEQARELERMVALTPYEARYRTPILLRFHEATTAAQNALLKTLEEPPPRVVFLLTADSLDRLLPTIVSRCESLKLRPLPIVATKEALMLRWRIEPGRAELLAHLSAGRIGWAAAMSSDDERLTQQAQQIEEMLGLLALRPRRGRLAYAEALAKRGRDKVEETLALWQVWWRDVLLAANAANAPYANLDRAETVGLIAQFVGAERAYEALRALYRTQEAIERNANLRLALEVLALDLPHVHSASTVLHKLIPTRSG